MVCGGIGLYLVAGSVLNWKDGIYSLIQENVTDWLTDWLSEKVTTWEAIASKNEVGVVLGL